MEEASREPDQTTRKRRRKEQEEKIGKEEALAVDLPDEILGYILLRLPVKSLLRLKGVCKSWQTLISHPHFAKTHLEYTNDVIHSRRTWCAISSSLPFGARRLFYGSSNGLLFLFSNTKALLWNPCTGECLIIPKTLRIFNKYVNTRPTNGSFCAGFGYDSSVDQYKAILAIRNPKFDPELHVFLFTSEAGSWTRIAYPYYFPYLLEPPSDVVTLNNRVPHWKVRRREGRLAIIYFDWTVERFDELLLPDPLLVCKDFCRLDVADLGGCICAIDRMSRRHIDVWAMKEHGVEDSWTKLFTIPMSDPFDILIPLEFSRNREVLVLRNYKELVTHDLTTGDEDYISSIGTHYRLELHSFVESLNSPNGAQGVWKLKKPIKVPKLLFLRNQENNHINPCTPQSGNNPAKQRNGSSSIPVKFYGDSWYHDIAKLIIVNDYPPLHLVEHPGFLAHLRSPQPQFVSMTFKTVQGVCIPTYLREKQSLQKGIEVIPGRMCLTLDWWHSSLAVGYVFLSGHYVDSYWVRRRQLLSVVMGRFLDSDHAFVRAAHICLSDWGLQGKLFSLTVSKALDGSSTETLRALLSIKNPKILNGQLVITNCIARTLNSLAKDVLVAGQDTIKNILESIKYVKISGSDEQKFLKLKRQLEGPRDSSQTPWSTTYQKLLAASELKKVFSSLDTSDAYYIQGPSMEDWKQVGTLCAFSKLLFDAANIFTSTSSSTANMFLLKVFELQLELARAEASLGHCTSNLTKPMKEKLDKYWNDCGLVLGIAVVMDPRFKMRFIEDSFPIVYGKFAPSHIKMVDEGIHELFKGYEVHSLPAKPIYEKGHIMEMFYAQFPQMTELDEYLREPLYHCQCADFDVLSWWKLERFKYPALSKMARDILSISICTVPPDWVFESAS